MVGIAEQCGSIDVGRVGIANADAEGHLHLHVIDERRKLAGEDDGGREFGGALAVRVRMHDGDELVATEPAEPVVGIEQWSDALGDLPQHFVAGAVAVHVVDSLESVHVDEQHRGLAIGMLQHALELGQGRPPGQPAGEVVGGGPDLLGLGQLVHVEERGDEVGNRAQELDVGLGEETDLAVGEVDGAEAAAAADERSDDRRTKTGTAQRVCVGVPFVEGLAEIVDDQGLCVRERFAHDRSGDRVHLRPAEGDGAADGTDGEVVLVEWQCHRGALSRDDLGHPARGGAQNGLLIRRRRYRTNEARWQVDVRHVTHAHPSARATWE